MNEQRVVRLARLLGDCNARGVRQAIARAGDELLENIIGIQRQRLIAFVENSTALKVVAVKTDGDEPAGDRLRGLRKRLLTLALAEVQLRRRRHRDLDYAVGQLTGRQLIEPDTIQAGVLVAHRLEDLLPNRGSKWNRFMRRSATRGRLARRRRVGRR